MARKVAGEYGWTMGLVPQVTTGFLRRKSMLANQKNLLRGGVWALLVFFGSACLAQNDPGVRPSPPGAGAALTGLTPVELSMFRPIREARLANKPDGTPDRGLHQLFTIVGRTDILPAGQSNTCAAEALRPTYFETKFQNGNLRFRIPGQMFGQRVEVSDGKRP
jgi:hypothetical protein